MSEPTKSALDDQVAHGKDLEVALRRAVRDAMLASAYAGQPVAVERDGQVVWLSPEQVFAELGAPPLAKPDDTAGAA
jgi:hypothetical protein